MTTVQSLAKKYGVAASVKASRNVSDDEIIASAIAFKQKVEAKFALVEKAKEWLKKMFVKSAAALVLTGMFAGGGTALAKGTVDNRIQKYTASLQQAVDKDGHKEIKWAAKATKAKAGNYILDIKAKNVKTGGYCTIQVIDPFKSVSGVQMDAKGDKVTNDYCKAVFNGWQKESLREMGISENMIRDLANK